MKFYAIVFFDKIEKKKRSYLWVKSIDEEEKESTKDDDTKEQHPLPANKRQKTKHERKHVVPPENTIVWKSYKKSMPKIPREVTEKLTGGIVSKNPETFVWSLTNPNALDNTNEQRIETGSQSTSVGPQKKDNENEKKESSSKEKMSIKKLLDE